MKNTLRMRCLTWLIAIAQIFIPFNQTFAAPGPNAALTAAVAGVNKLHTVGALVKAVRKQGQFFLAGEMETIAKKAGFTVETALPVFVQKGNQLTVVGYPQPLIVENLFPLTIKKGKESWTVKKGADLPETYKSLVRFLGTRQARLDSIFNILIPEVMAQQQNALGSYDVIAVLGYGALGIGALGVFHEMNRRTAAAEELDKKRKLEEKAADEVATQALKDKYKDHIVSTVCSPPFSEKFIAGMSKDAVPELVNVTNANYEWQLYPHLGDAKTRVSVITTTWQLPNGQRETIEYKYTFTGAKNGHDINSANEFSNISVSARSRAGMPIEVLIKPPKEKHNAPFKDVFVEEKMNDGNHAEQMQFYSTEDFEYMKTWSMDSAKSIRLDNEKLSSFDEYLAESNSDFLRDICKSDAAKKSRLAKNGINTDGLNVAPDANAVESGR